MSPFAPSEEHPVMAFYKVVPSQGLEPSQLDLKRFFPKSLDSKTKRNVLPYSWYPHAVNQKDKGIEGG